MLEDYLYERRLAAAMGVKQSPHFTEDLYHEAVDSMENDDGSKGPHYDLEKVKELIKEHKVDLGENNLLDYAYVCNMVWSDFSQVIGDKDKDIVEYANAWIFDTDAPSGKAFRYFYAMKFLEI